MKMKQFMGPNSFTLVFLHVVLSFFCLTNGILLISPLSPQNLCLDRKNIKEIAIIGAGPAGSSAAYHLKQFAKKAGTCINITVFERNSYIGGRVLSVNAYDDVLQPVEIGSMIYSSEANPIMKNASETFGLKNIEDYTFDDTMGIWNGNEFPLTLEGKDSGFDFFRMFLRYGTAPLRVEYLKKKILASYRKLYEYPHFPFKSLTSKVHELGLDAATNKTGAQLLSSYNIKNSYATEVVQSATRVAYGQNLDTIHGAQTMVCLGIDGATMIAGGNQQIFEKMINASRSTILLNTTVSRINRSKIKTGYDVTFSDNHHMRSQYFDSVVLAAPYHLTNITTENDMLSNVPENIPFVKLHVTLFTSVHAIDPTFFNRAPGKKVPATILTTLPTEKCAGCSDKPEFFSISRLRPMINPKTNKIENLYKVFSAEALNASFLSKLLAVDVPGNLTTSDSTISWYYPYVWENAYPHAHPRTKFDPSELARDFWYTSGIESFLSTMETSALMGMNIARLIVDGQLEAVQGGLNAHNS